MSYGSQWLLEFHLKCFQILAIFQRLMDEIRVRFVLLYFVFLTCVLYFKILEIKKKISKDACQPTVQYRFWYQWLNACVSLSQMFYTKQTFIKNILCVLFSIYNTHIWVSLENILLIWSLKINAMKKVLYDL